MSNETNPPKKHVHRGRQAVVKDVGFKKVIEHPLMLPIDFKSVGKAAIEELIANSVRESKSIEYKRCLPGGSDREKKEFLADVSSFANCIGGDLLYGIIEENDLPRHPIGMPLDDVGSTTLRIESMIRTGVEPRIQGIQIHTIDSFVGGCVMHLRIPRSWAAPHMVTFGGTSRFYTRNNRGKYPMDLGEIRTAFDLAGNQPERIRRIRDQKIGQIVSDETTVPLVAGARILLLVIPLSALSDPTQIDPSLITEQQNCFNPIYGLGDRRFNIDGFLTTSNYREDRQRFDGYCQVFRSGIVEAVDVRLLGESQQIRSLEFEREVFRAVRRYSDGLRQLGLLPPLFVHVSVIGANGYELIVQPQYHRFDPPTVDRNIVLLPEVILTDFAGNLAATMQPVFDALWNAGGFPRSMNYDENGEWNVSAD